MTKSMSKASKYRHLYNSSIVKIISIVKPFKAVQTVTLLRWMNQIREHGWRLLEQCNGCMKQVQKFAHKVAVTLLTLVKKLLFCFHIKIIILVADCIYGYVWICVYIHTGWFYTSFFSISFWILPMIWLSHTADHKYAINQQSRTNKSIHLYLKRICT